eukprot:COSAG04_NODE_15_length_40535_cov_25.319888_21_plen_401_part_00
MTALWESYSSTLHDDALTQPSDALQGGSSSFSEEQDEEFGVDDDALIAATQAVEAQQAAAAAAADPDNGGGGGGDDDGADDDSMDALFASLPDSMVSGAPPAAADAQAAPPQKPGALVEPTSAPVSPVSPVKDAPAADAAPDTADPKPEAEEKPAAEEDEERRGEAEAEAPDAVSAELSFSPPAAVPAVGSQGSRYSRSPSPCFDDDDDDDEDESMDGMATQAWAGDEGAAVGDAEPAEEQATAAPDAEMAADDSSDPHEAVAAEAVPDAEPEDAAPPAAAPDPSVAEESPAPKVEVVEEPLAPKVTKIELVFVPTEGRDAGKLAVKWNTKEPFIEMTLALGACDPQKSLRTGIHAIHLIRLIRLRTGWLDRRTFCCAQVTVRRIRSGGRTTSRRSSPRA